MIDTTALGAPRRTSPTFAELLDELTRHAGHINDWYDLLDLVRAAEAMSLNQNVTITIEAPEGQE